MSAKNPDERNAAVARELYRNLKIAAVLSVALLALLAVAPARGYFSEWRAIQKRYNDGAAAQGASPIPVGIKQIWRPEIGLTDRCTSCHLGKGAATPFVAGLFGPHPEVHHDVSRMGCTICHRGQGQATTRADAHGNVAHWEDPMLPRELLQASCGQCHGVTARVPALERVERGEYLFELHGCKSCHAVDGEGGVVGPDLSGVALKGLSREWHVEHLRQPAQAVEGSRMMSFGHLSDDEIDALLAYLDTLIGAPKLIRGKAIAIERGCRGCHKIGGRGGDHGPALADSAKIGAHERDFSNLDGPHTSESWHRQHLRDPARATPGSKMPPVVLSPEDEDALLVYILSQRDDDLPLELLPKETILARLEGAVDHDQSDGALIYQIYCSACHGREGRGQVMPTLGVTAPAIANPDVLALTSDDYLRATIKSGRTGRDMPAWGGPAGLSDGEITAVIGYLRSRQPRRPPFVDVAAIADPSAELGARIFSHDCAGCHGIDGAGTELAPSLANPELQLIATDELLYETITGGRADTAMPAHRHYSADEVAGLIAWLRRDLGRSAVTVGSERLEPPAAAARLAEILHVDRLESYTATGSPAYGKTLYSSLCVGCHGVDGRGGNAPALANPAFLEVASDGFIAGSMLLGRGQRAMRSFTPEGVAPLRARDVGDVIAYLRVAARAEHAQRGFKKVRGEARRGKRLYAELCVGCHGADGRGGFAPALNNPAFLAAVTDGFLQATIARGRRGTSMRGWAIGGYGFAEVTAAEINDLVTYIRSWQAGN